MNKVLLSFERRVDHKSSPMRRLALLGAISALVPLVLVACGSKDTSSSSTQGGCQTNGDCTGDTVCESGVCVAPSSGPGTGSSKGTGASATGGSSSANGGSSNGGSGGSAATCSLTFSGASCESCFAANCVDPCASCEGDSACGAALSCITGCSSSSCADDCLSGLPTESQGLFSALLGDPNGCLYSSCRSECTTASPNGDPCVVDDDCQSGTCAGWCTIDGCASNVQCGIDTAGELVWCSAATGGSYQCFPGCSSDADCEAYSCGSSAPTCVNGTSINGSSDTICGC
jgi:hypothetical protein